MLQARCDYWYCDRVNTTKQGQRKENNAQPHPQGPQFGSSTPQASTAGAAASCLLLCCDLGQGKINTGMPTTIDPALQQGRKQTTA
jgi:hypothetical protein